MLFRSNNNPEYYKLKADIFQQESDFENALLFFKKVIEKNPSYDVLAQMGDCCEKLDDIDTAIDYYIQAIQLRPNDIRIMFRLILAYYSINEPDKAIELSHQIDHIITQMQENKESLSEEERIDLEETNKMINNIKKVLSELLGTDL